MKHSIFIVLVVNSIFLTLFAGCSESNAVLPKPRMYPRVIYPDKKYMPFIKDDCSFNFQMPAYGTIIKDSFKFEGVPENPCWFDLNLPDLNASLHCSYYAISPANSLSTLINDAFNLAGKHNIKANYRKESIIDNDTDVKGIMFEIEGPVASPLQFYLTDEKKHFFRASLYFNATVNPDSTAPVLQFIKPDLDTLISSFSWR